MPYAVLEKEIERLDETQRNAVVLFVRFLLSQKAGAANSIGLGEKPRKYDFSDLEAVSMRIECGLKLPDAVISATALVNGCAVISNDEHFQRQSKVEVKTYTSRSGENAQRTRVERLYRITPPPPRI